MEDFFYIYADGQPQALMLWEVASQRWVFLNKTARQLLERVPHSKHSFAPELHWTDFITPKQQRQRLAEYLYNPTTHKYQTTVCIQLENRSPLVLKIEAQHYPSSGLVVCSLEPSPSVKERQLLINVLQEATDTGVWDYNPINQELSCSLMVWQIFGLPPINTHPNPRLFADFFSPVDWWRFRRRLVESVRDQHPFELELPLNIESPNQHWLRVAGFFNFADDHVTRAYGVVQDISNYKQIAAFNAELLKESQHLNRDLVVLNEEISLALDKTLALNRSLSERDILLNAMNASSHLGILTVDTQGTVTYANSAIEALFELSIPTINYQQLSACIHPDDWAQTKALWQQTREQLHKVSHICRIITAQSQTTKWLQVQVSPMLVGQGQLLGFVGTYEDITEKVQREQALTQTNQKLNIVLEGANLGLWEWEIETKKLSINDMLLKLLGFTREQFNQELSADGLTLIHREDREQLKQIVAAYVADQQPRFQAEFRYYTRSGALRWANALGQIIQYDAQGAPLLIMGVFQDIDTIKQAQVDMLRAKEEAEAANQAKDDFLSTMTHEIRTPLSAIVGISRILQQKSLDPEQLKQLQVLNFASENLMSIINDILDFSKIQANMISLEDTPLSLGKTVRYVIEALRPQAISKGLALIEEIDEYLFAVIIQGDSLRLAQIFTNLISNAIKFTNKGFVKVILEVVDEDDYQITVATSIEDTGIGIAPNKHAYIFERFTQADTHTTRKFGGTGLGLAITKKLLALHQSDIKLESNEGQGSRFSFNIQFTKALHQSTSADEPYDNTHSDVKDLAQMRLLVVEDNELNRFVIAQFLQQWNAQADYAATGLEALDKIAQSDAQNSYQLILLDLQMPDMDGYEVMRVLRQMPKPLGNIPVMALTAEINPQSRMRCIQVGMQAVLTKPFNPEVLYAQIQYLSRPNQAASAPSKQEIHLVNHPISKQNIDIRMILEAAGGDLHFIQKYLETLQQQFDYFIEEYSSAIQKKDMEQMQRAVHRLRPTIVMLNLRLMEREIVIARNKFKDKLLNEKFIAGSVLRIQKIIDATIAHLKQALLASIDG